MTTAASLVTSAPSAPTPRRAVESRDPATGEVWRRYEAASPEVVHAALRRAREAQRAWAATSLDERARMLGRFHDVLYARREEVARTIMRENGKPAAEALGTEIIVVLDYAKFFARAARRELGRTRWEIPRSLAMWRKRLRVTHEPYGVIGVISPWNYPFMLAAGEILPALVAGNAVVHKPSEFTPSTGVLLGELLQEAGAPADVIQTLTGDGATGAALTAGAVDKVFFIGSLASGRKVAVACAERMVPCVLELGGSDPAIVLEDADLATAASGIAWGRFSNAGQTCVAPKRVFVVDAAYDGFVAALSKVVGALRVGPGHSHHTDVTPLIRPEQTATLRAQLDDALARGARVLAQGRLDPDADPTAYFPPTVLSDVNGDMRVLTEETFGPLLPVVRVRDADEAVARANASPFGLSASIWTRDTTRALGLAERLEAGTVAINDAIVTAGMAEVPHGGVKESGTGRSHGLAGLLECVRTKTIVADRWSGWRQPWWFGYGEEHAKNLDAFARVAHAHSLRERLSGVRRTVRLLLRPERPL